MFAPEGAYGDQGITRGVMVGTYNGQNRNLSQDTRDYVNEVLQGNNYLRQRGEVSRASIDGRQGNMTALTGRSPITNRTEIVNIYTTQLRNGSLFYAITVVPEEESYNYSSTFRNVLNSVQLND